MAALGTAEVDCPRCDDKIVVTIEAGTPETSKPGAKTIPVPVRIVDLADRFAEHYETAGHTSA